MKFYDIFQLLFGFNHFYMRTELMIFFFELYFDYCLNYLLIINIIKI